VRLILNGNQTATPELISITILCTLGTESLSATIVSMGNNKTNNNNLEINININEFINLINSGSNHYNMVMVRGWNRSVRNFEFLQLHGAE